jgi:hypothetical protein
MNELTTEHYRALLGLDVNWIVTSDEKSFGKGQDYVSVKHVKSKKRGIATKYLRIVGRDQRRFAEHW